ncbi:hypothetical protein AAES_39441 [Amazona aestiva]|uniref:Reverse transcriptase/retrotransposon-derived protein RNase H-like domain-containing protein n=1 Tax=Amazona aestiva TaxID=12930 RepID=A0A0Q3MT39_AMAAE|nr:hypothetical protein AAES_39441 [Amazona aestiva]
MKVLVDNVQRNLAVLPNIIISNDRHPIVADSQLQLRVKGPAREIQLLGITWQGGRHQIPTGVINKITAMSPPTNKKETQDFFCTVGLWRMHIPNYSLIVSPLYHGTLKKNDFKWGPEQQQAFEQIKREIVHAVALGAVRTGPDVKNVLYTAAGENDPTWSLWQKAPGETRGRPLGFWKEVFEKGRKTIQILLKAGFAINWSKVKGPAQEIQLLGIKWQGGRHQIPTVVINKITAMSPPTNKKETQAFLDVVGFWRMHIPNYSLIVSPLYHGTLKKNDFKCGPEQQQAFEQIKREIVHAVALGPVRTGPDVKNVLYTAARENDPTWSLWQKAPGETRGRPLGFWSQ